MSLLLTTILTHTKTSFCGKFHLILKYQSVFFQSDCSILRRSVNITNMDEMSLSLMSRQLAPSLADGKYKGQAGRVGVFGGSLEYTGAPYFSAISALKVGADLVHIFCCEAAATVIKSYSPELIVHPLLDVENSIDKIEPWLDRLHVLLIGPGLGRESSTFMVITKVIEIARRKKKPLVIDADGLFLITKEPHLLNDFPCGIILTPNAMEYARLLGYESPSAVENDSSKKLFAAWGNNVTILRKGPDDIITDYAKSVKVSGGGSGRRCGGQGDILGGSLAVFYAWALQHKLDVDVPHDDRAMIACFAACKLIRDCNSRAFRRLGRSMLASDMISEIHPVFEEYFELK